MDSNLKRIERQSVQTHPDADNGIFNMFLSFAGAANGIVEWGVNPQKRDQDLRIFYRSEDWLGSTVASLAARNGAFSWTLDGPPRTCGRIQDMLHASNFGKGWVHLMQQITTDILTQDNGAFVEIIRAGKSPSAPILGLAHLDAGRCVRTGNIEVPVVYIDRDNIQHKLLAHQVIDFVDAPSTEETMNGVGFCAVSRALRYSQILRDIAIYQNEKVSGRNPSALHIVSGIKTDQISDAIKKNADNADNQMLTRWQLPVVMGTIDPTAVVNVATILLKALPDGFSQEEWMKWFIALLALAFGCEYQDLAPLPGGGLGSSAQSEVLHMKAKGKGSELFQKQIEHKLNFSVLPENVTFKFTERDIAQETSEADVKLKKAQRYASYVTMGIPLKVVAQIMEDEQELKGEYLAMMAEEDITDDETVADDEHMDAEGDITTDQMIDEDEQVAPPAVPPVAKELTADDYWGPQRAKLERDYTDEMAATLAEVQAEITKRLRGAISEG
jgi:hypothetical protein